MPQTIDKTFQGQIICGIFSSRENADRAIKAFQAADVSFKDIQILLKLNDEEAKDNYTNLMIGRGFSESQALYYHKVVHQGKVLVAVYEVLNPALIIDIFDKHNAEYNPNGSRNVRQDVIGMTTGAVVGAATLGAVGGIVAGPVGAAAGAAAGAVIGGGSGAAAGKLVEHSK